jgi:guanine deaminase
MVHTEDGSAVRDVMIGGRLVVKDRRVTTVDMAALRRDAEAARRRLTEVNAPTRALCERLAPVVAATVRALRTCRTISTATS